MTYVDVKRGKSKERNMGMDGGKKEWTEGWWEKGKTKEQRNIVING
jgi:hypothetical protein